jgi:hypothetical protein
VVVVDGLVDDVADEENQVQYLLKLKQVMKCLLM